MRLFLAVALAVAALWSYELANMASFTDAPTIPNASILIPHNSIDMAKDEVLYGYALLDDTKHTVSIDDIDRPFTRLHNSTVLTVTMRCTPHLARYNCRISVTMEINASIANTSTT